MKILIPALVLIVGLIAEAYGGCINCGFGPGKDICTSTKVSSCTPMVVRPNKLPKIDITELCKPKIVYKEVCTGLKPLKPIGDLCSYKKAIVTPAFVPKTACALCAPAACSCASSSSAASSSSSSSSSASASSAHFATGISSGVQGIYVDAADNCGQSSGSYTGGNYAAADAVSLSLAYKLQHELNNIAEDKLFFGFHKMPKEIQVTKKVKNTIAEENLFGHNGQVVELKPVIVGNAKTIEEEAEEALLDEEMNQDVAEFETNGVKKLTYDEIGFGPAQIKTTPYIEVKGTGVEATAQATSATSAQECRDGFRPGKVIINPIRTETVCFERTSGGYGSGDSSDEDREEAYSMGGVSYPSFSYSSSHSSSSASSSSSSSSSSHHSIGGHKIIFEKLGACDE